MYYRNLTVFRLADEAVIALGDPGLQNRLEEAALQPIAPSALRSRGWVSPYGTEAMFQQVDGCLQLVLGGEDRILPASAVNAELGRRLKAIEEREGKKLGGKARRNLRDDVLAEMIPRALLKPYRLAGYIDRTRGILVVDTSSRKQAEDWVSHLRMTLGSFPARPESAKLPVRQTLTDLLGDFCAPRYKRPVFRGHSVVLGDSCVLSGDDGTIRFSRASLTDEAVAHIEAGWGCTSLDLQLGDRFTFSVDENLTVRRFKLSDVVIDSLSGFAADSLGAELDARFALLTAAVRLLWDLVDSLFGLWREGGVFIDAVPAEKAEA